MPEKPERPEDGRRIDLSMTQVAASALAAVVGAVLASELGVYGTIIGAAVVSIGATCGGAVFQHLFRRTGEQLREVTEWSPGRRANGLRQIPASDTAPLPLAWRDEPDGPGRPQPLPDGSWSASPVRRARRRWTWKGYAAVSALVFVLAMIPIVAVELASGQNLHAITTGQEGGGTSILPDGGRRSPDRAPRTEPAAPPTGRGASEHPSAATGGPSAAPTGGSGSGSPSPSPSAPSSSAPPSGGATPSGAAAPGGTPSAPPTTRAPQSPAPTRAPATDAPATELPAATAAQ
ncbi:hypothetical protein LN042_19540 [Kitasatospora sp. RB6PN24]|uniref:hypothetical protein n=1 Tax=Kitasatospora humi TaxID=2893891 RepID=UPI001E3141A2|nr:hypothetical protein [Kitasatospora humi]MCC9309252.1 hypothetical protein [Kitasatospora humi]